VHILIISRPISIFSLLPRSHPIHFRGAPAFCSQKHIDVDELQRMSGVLFLWKILEHLNSIIKIFRRFVKNR